MLDIPAVVDNFREQLASGRLRISLTPEEFEEMLNRGEAAKSYEAEFRCGMAGGGWNWFRMIYIVVSTEESHRRPIRLIGCLSDIESERRERDMLLDMGQKDALTGLLNRAAGEKQICEALNESALGSILLVIDIDHFKSINDTWGHDVGDEAIVALTRQLQITLRGSDVIGRFGGDEFAVIMSGTPAESAITAMLRVHEGLNTLRLPNTPQVMLRISVGVAPLNPQMSHYREWLKSADLALYKAKKAGRNRTEVAA